MANVNETVTAHSSVANGSYLTIQPSAGQEYIVQNIYGPYGSALELYRTDGTNDIKIDYANSEGGWGLVKHFVTNGIYLKVKNVSGGSIYVGYDGVRIV